MPIPLFLHRGRFTQFTSGPATQFFRQKGWEVWNEFPETGQELVACVRQHSFAVIGLSVATMSSMASLPKTVRQLRKASSNPAVCIMVGGPLLLEHPELVSRIGADATAVDAREAALREPGDIVQTNAEVSAELGELLNGRQLEKKKGPVVIKSVGNAIEDIAAAKLVYDKR